VEKVYKYDEFIRYGRIIGAEYRGKVGVFRTFWFAPGGEQPEGYYLADGRSAKKTFLATPLRFKRISSKFNPKRKHPILGYTKAHTGVDYAASRGTPVWAMASGRVVFAGRKGANGNLVTIDHGNGLRSYYAHLHRIARGIRKGAKIKQKQTLGSVGSTGRSTGPHLHFAVRRNGKWVNPARLKMNRGRPVAKRSRAAFERMIDERMVLLRQIRVDPAPLRPRPPRQPTTR
jgi:murein DD-endopeptidase MepM/ murein hydrolase activator NlpD